MGKPYYNFCMTHTLIPIPSYLFIINQPKVSFQFLIFQESFYMVFTSTYHYFFYPVSHFETANGIHYLYVWDLVTSHFINLYRTIVFQYLESTLHTLIVATSDRPRTSLHVVRNNLVKMVYIKLVNPSIVLRGSFGVGPY